MPEVGLVQQETCEETRPEPSDTPVPLALLQQPLSLLLGLHLPCVGARDQKNGL